MVQTATYNFSSNISMGLSNALLVRCANFTATDLGTLFIARTLATIASIPLAAHALSRNRHKRKTLWDLGGTINALLPSALILVPMMGFGKLYVALVIFVVAQATGTIASIASSDVIADLVPPDIAYDFFKHVNRIIYMTNVLSLLIGIVAFNISDSLFQAYAAVYSISAIAALISSVALSKIKDAAAAMEDPQGNGRNIASALTHLLANPSLRNYLLIQAMLSFAVGVPSPFWDFLILKVLGGTEVIILAKNSVGLLARVFSTHLWSRLFKTNGAKKPTVMGLTLVSAVPAIYALLPNALASLPAEAFSGFAWTSMDFSSTLYSLYLPKRNERVFLNSVLNMVNSVAGVVSAALGTAIASHGSILYPFWVSAALRLTVVAASSFALPELRPQNSDEGLK
ncbi:MAG: hypothetical protein ABWK00_01015 [Desulfurococcaceae archaeon]